jgi:hypothetical protein
MMFVLYQSSTIASCLWQESASFIQTGFPPNLPSSFQIFQQGFHQQKFAGLRNKAYIHDILTHSTGMGWGILTVMCHQESDLFFRLEMRYLHPKYGKFDAGK